MTDGQTGVRTFLIADVRGYSRFTEEYGDEAAARLAAKFARVAADEVEAHGGRVVEIRGDEALAVFTSARQAIRAGVALQRQFDLETEADSDLPLRAGIGIDAGEAVELEDGSFRGAALNIAARLCGRAHGGEVLVSESTSRLAGRLAGLQYVDQGRVRLKNIPDPIHILKVYSELDALPANRWIVMFFGRQPGRTLSWKLGAFVALIAVAAALAAVYLTTNDHGDGSKASSSLTTGGGTTTGPGTPAVVTAKTTLKDLVPTPLWKDCKLQTVADPNALQTAVCVPPRGPPDRWQISTYPSGSRLTAAYSAELRRHPTIKHDTGKCNAFSWGGERPWLHGPEKPGGRVFCYFDGDNAVIVWTHARLGQSNHRDVLGIAYESGSDHVRLTRWWRPWHHLIGKAGS
ncbi:MAG TPA: adenylate/guanylate cyclase domain-containing protein [Gaiellaceae bacterium]|nr:adenylate/guanylate cyclase domain-containing protein [Gaiellaceae bacterium]